MPLMDIIQSPMATVAYRQKCYWIRLLLYITANKRCRLDTTPLLEMNTAARGHNLRWTLLCINITALVYRR